MQETQTRTGLVLRSVVLIVLLLGAGSALGALFYVFRVEPPRQAVNALPPLVDAIVVEPEDVVEAYVGYGSAHAFREASLSAEVAAVVRERVGGIRAGSTVNEGQVLFRLDDRQYQHAMTQALARAEAERASLAEVEADAAKLEELLVTARKELRVARDEKLRVTRLFEQGVAAKKEFDFADLAYRQAERVVQNYEREAARVAARLQRFEALIRAYEADAAVAQLNIERCEIVAPFPGRLAAVMVDVGDRVAPGTPVATLMDTSRVEIPVQLPASVYDQVAVDTAVALDREGNRPGGWRGRIARIAPQVDRDTRQFAAYVIVDNREQDTPLMPGMFVRAQVHGPAHQAALLVPRSACRDGTVFVVEDDVAMSHPVAPDGYIEDRAIVTGQIERGARVIVSHLSDLADGTPVRVRPPATALTNGRAPDPQPTRKVSP